MLLAKKKVKLFNYSASECEKMLRNFTQGFSELSDYGFVWIHIFCY